MSNVRPERDDAPISVTWRYICPPSSRSSRMRGRAAATRRGAGSVIVMNARPSPAVYVTRRVRRSFGLELDPLCPDSAAPRTRRYRRYRLHSLPAWRDETRLGASTRASVRRSTRPPRPSSHRTIWSRLAPELETLGPLPILVRAARTSWSTVSRSPCASPSRARLSLCFGRPPRVRVPPKTSRSASSRRTADAGRAS